MLKRLDWSKKNSQIASKFPTIFLEFKKNFFKFPSDVRTFFPSSFENYLNFFIDVSKITYNFSVFQNFFVSLSASLYVTSTYPSNFYEIKINTSENFLQNGSKISRGISQNFCKVILWLHSLFFFKSI